MKAERGTGAFFDEFAGLFLGGSTEECWPFTQLNTNGYGKLMFEGRQTSAHRLSYEMHWGPIPAGVLVCHHCDNKACVNPLHLFLGSHKDNTQDMVRKGRQRNQHMAQTHCKRGHEFTPENTRVYDGRRYCRACDNARSKARPRGEQ